MELMTVYIFVSSTNNKTLILSSNMDGKSLIKIRNKRGSKCELCGTLEYAMKLLDKVFDNITC